MKNPNELSRAEVEKSNASTSYMDIKPQEKMSAEDVDGFWKSEFSHVEEGHEVDPYDALLSEVFNCSEEEIPIDLDIDGNLQSTLDRFSPEHWEELDEDEKIDAIENLKDSICDRLDLYDEPEVDFYEVDGDEYGFFNPEDNTININRKHLDNPKELVDTIAHELRHAYQYKHAELLETKTDAMYRVNFDNYISPVYLPAGGCLYFFDYWNQYVEADARAFANKLTETIV